AHEQQRVPALLLRLPELAQCRVDRSDLALVDLRNDVAGPQTLVRRRTAGAYVHDDHTSNVVRQSELRAALVVQRREPQSELRTVGGRALGAGNLRRVGRIAEPDFQRAALALTDDLDLGVLARP